MLGIRATNKENNLRRISSLARDGAIDDQLARILFEKIEHLSPTDLPAWELLNEGQKEFYRCCVEALLVHVDLINLALGQE